MLAFIMKNEKKSFQWTFIEEEYREIKVATFKIQLVTFLNFFSNLFSEFF